MKTFGGKFLLAALAVLLALAAHAPAQKKSKKQEPTTGAISGRVRVAPGATPGGVAVTVRRGDEEVTRRETNSKGEFEFQGLEPGTYGLTFATGDWFAAARRETFYPSIQLVVDLGGPHTHVALLLSPFSYTTYKGS